MQDPGGVVGKRKCNYVRTECVWIWKCTVAGALPCAITSSSDLVQPAGIRIPSSPCGLHPSRIRLKHTANSPSFNFVKLRFRGLGFCSLRDSLFDFANEKVVLSSISSLWKDDEDTHMAISSSRVLPFCLGTVFSFSTYRCFLATSPAHRRVAIGME